MVLMVLCLVQAGTPAAQAGRERSRARFWIIDPADYEQKTGDAFFPEASQLPAEQDIGVAFSGGGVRSASATIGELRGLETAGLLGRVRYASAVSGGSWSLIPWTYSGARNLLGEYREPAELTFDDVHTRPNGRMVEELSNVSLVSDEIRETVLQIWEANVPADAQQAARAARRLLGQAERPDGVYTTLLARNLIGNLVPGASTSDFVWNAAQEAEMRAHNPGASFQILQAQPRRPFMIVNANVLNIGRDLAHPGATPIEITPLYVGARQQIGGLFGGLYAWPMAYNAVTARRSSDADGFLDVTRDSGHPRMTLADAAAASGAAPLYWVAGGNGLATNVRDLLGTRVAAFFPSFTHLAMRDDVLKPTVSWPHADGGARDNLGVMALLARHVKRIVVFVNTLNPDFANNNDIRALFVEGSLSPSGDKRGLVVLGGGARAYDTVVDGFTRARQDNRALVTCGTFDVIGNRLFNVRPYAEASICWVYPDLATNWVDALRDEKLKRLATGQCPECENEVGRFSNFPWYDTFFQNRNLIPPQQFGILKLTTAQVNLLADLMAWSVVESKAVIERAFSSDR